MGTSEEKAVEQAFERKNLPSPIKTHSSLITSSNQVDSTFRAMQKVARKNGVSLNAIPATDVKTIERQIKRRAQTGTSATSVFETFHSPFRLRTTIEQPTERKELNDWYRFYYKKDPIVGACIDLHTEFPMSFFSVEHEDKEVEEFFNEQLEENRMFDLLVNMVRERLVCGEAFPFGFFDDPDDPTCWEGFVLLDPNYVKINAHRLLRGSNNYQIRMVMDDDIKKIVNNGPNDKATGTLYAKLPGDIIEAVRKNMDLELNSVQASHFKRVGNPFNIRGESIIARLLDTLMYRDKLRDAQYCLKPDTEVLCYDGFKPISTVTNKDVVATYNINNNHTEYASPIECVNFDFDGKLLHFKNRKVDFTCTPNHRMLVQTTTNNWKVKLAKDVKHTNRVKASANWKGESVPETVNMAGYDIPIETYLEFAGYFLSEGYSQKTKVNAYITSISQKKDTDNYFKIKECLKKLPFKINECVNTNKAGCVKSDFNIFGKDLVNHMILNFGGTCFFKKIPTWIKHLSPKYLNILIQACCLGDGHRRFRPSYSDYMVYATVSKALADDMEEIVWKCGYYPGMSYETYEVKGEKRKIYKIYWSFENKTNFGLGLKKGEKQENGTWDESNVDNSWKTEEYYKGKVYCLVVANSFFVTRQNGRISIHGNSVCDRHLTPLEIYKIGTDEQPADDAEIQAFQDLLSQTWTSPNKAIVWHHALQVQIEGASGKLLPLQGEFDMIERNLLAGLGVSKVFLDGTGPTFANASIAMDAMISRYLTLRNGIEDWLNNHFFGPLCEIHEIYEPRKGRNRFKIKDQKKKPWFPKYRWVKSNLRDDASRIQLLQQLKDKGMISKRTLWRVCNLDPDIMEQELKEEREKDLQAGIAIPGGAPGGLPKGLDMPPSMDTPYFEGDLPEETISPEGGGEIPFESPLEGGPRQMPPESTQGPVEMPVGL